jgi:hypothetical protein
MSTAATLQRPARGHGRPVWRTPAGSSSLPPASWRGLLHLRALRSAAPKEMGVVLGIAVLLDAALIRPLPLPVLLRLTGKAAWASPAWLRRLLRTVRFSH